MVGAAGWIAAAMDSPVPPSMNSGAGAGGGGVGAGVTAGLVGPVPGLLRPQLGMTKAKKMRIDLQGPSGQACGEPNRICFDSCIGLWCTAILRRLLLPRCHQPTARAAG